MSNNAKAIVLRTMADIATQMVEQGDWNDDALAEEATALAQRLNEEARAIEAPRTPESVLHAMLRAYEAVVLAGDEAAARGEKLSDRGRVFSEWGDVRRALANYRVWGVVPQFVPRLHQDYEARLSGARPLDAPPLEEP